MVHDPNQYNSKNKVEGGKYDPNQKASRKYSMMNVVDTHVSEESIKKYRKRKCMSL